MRIVVQQLNDKGISTFREKATFEKARLNKCFKFFSNLVEDTALGSRIQMSTFFSFGPGTWAINPYLGVKLRPFQKFLAGGMGGHNAVKKNLKQNSK